MNTAPLTVAFIIGCVLMPSMARAQAPSAPPAPGFTLHDQQTIDRFVVQRWVSATNPEVSPAGFCECVTVVYEGSRLVMNLGVDAGITAVSAVTDITGDRRAELMITNYSGGAHCCQSLAIYSVDAIPRPLLSLSLGDCMGELTDLDKDGVAELRTCDATYGYAFCSFAFSPFPPVVYAYDKGQGTFVLATPRYARYLRLVTAVEARKTIAENPHQLEIARCAALAPALGLIYTGRVAQGQRLFRQLYNGADAAAVEQKAMAIAMQSDMWVAR